MIGKITICTRGLPNDGEAQVKFIFKDFLKDDQAIKTLPEKIIQKLQKRISKHNFLGNKNEIITIENDSSPEEFFLSGAGKKSEFSLTLFRDLLADVLRAVVAKKYNKVDLLYFNELGTNYFEIGKNLSLSFYLANYDFDKFKGTEAKKKIHRIEELNFIVGIDEKNKNRLEEGISLGKLIAEGIYLARNLINEPASHVHPATLVEQAFKIEKESKGKIKVEILDKDECRRLGMGAFLGVAEGSDKEPKFIILTYKNPKSKIQSSKSLCIVGKSITFDSGGLSLKPSSGMKDMKIDMAGGATVLAVFQILSSLDLNHEIYGILPACENMPSGRAIKPGDIVTALNGKTIEVLNTDAEGRLALADALSYAEKYLKADYVIDIATLTGACRVALGADITAVIGNDRKFINDFIDSAKAENEQIWELPLYKHYLDHMKGEITDLKNVGQGKGAGTITAALFLSEFVEKSKWLHLDIAGSSFRTEKSKGIIGKGATGWGVLTILKFLTDYL